MTASSAPRFSLSMTTPASPLLSKNTSAVTATPRIVSPTAPALFNGSTSRLVVSIVWIDSVRSLGVPGGEHGREGDREDRRRHQATPKLSTRLSVISVPTTLISTTASQ